MIAGSLDVIRMQSAATPGIGKAMDFLSRPDIGKLKDGRIEIDGDSVFALVQRYETVVTESPRYESHRKYIDLQFIVSGREEIGWIASSGMKITEAYDAGSDICFGIVPDRQGTRLCLQSGQAALFYPDDGHAPKLAAGAPCQVMKIVVKIAVKEDIRHGKEG